MRFVTHLVGKHSPCLQILVYPLLQLFDMMLPSRISKAKKALDPEVSPLLVEDEQLSEVPLVDIYIKCWP